MKPEITIGITCFNEGELLKQCWESVKNQTDVRWELIIVLDGGANRTTENIFDSINDHRVTKLKLKENGGPYNARTIAISQASTEWYYHLDADDLLPKEAVRAIVETIRLNPNVEYILGNCLYFNDSLNEIKKYSKIDKERLVFTLPINGQCPIKIKLFNKIGGFAKELYSGGADWDFWISVVENDPQYVYLDEVIYERRIRKDSVGSRRRFNLHRVAQIVVERHPTFFNTANKINRCLGRAHELVARNYRSAGKRKLAYEHALQAKKMNNKNPTLTLIIEEKNMNLARYLMRRMGRLKELFY